MLDSIYLRPPYVGRRRTYLCASRKQNQLAGIKKTVVTLKNVLKTNIFTGETDLELAKSPPHILEQVDKNN